MWHVFHLHAPKLPEARRAIDAIGVFVRQRLKEQYSQAKEMDNIKCQVGA